MESFKSFNTQEVMRHIRDWEAQAGEQELAVVRKAAQAARQWRCNAFLAQRGFPVPTD
jgi:hypothetical protein